MDKSKKIGLSFVVIMMWVVYGLFSLGVPTAIAQRSAPNSTTTHDVTYANLKALISSNGLVIGDHYRLTDFRTRFTIPNTHDTHTGRVEVLVLTAISETTLDRLAISEEYPEDIIHYTVSNDTLFINDADLGMLIPDPAVDRGYIMYRKDTVRNVEVGEDFRNMIFRRWETEPGNGIYAQYYPWNSPAGSRYQDFPMFADYSATSEVHIDHHRSNGNGAADGNFLSNVVFRGYTYKVEMLDGAQNGTFLGGVIELSMKFCSKGIFYGNLEQVVLGTSSELTATGNLYSVYVNKSEMLLDGNFRNVEVLANYTSNEIIGDYSNKVFGAKTENTYNLTPANAGDIGGNKKIILTCSAPTMRIS